MRNLTVTDKRSVHCPHFSNCNALTIEDNSIYFVSNGELCKLDISPVDATEQFEVLAPLDIGNVLDIKYLPEEDVLALVSCSGCVAVFNLQQFTIDIVGDVEGGISACCWSPDIEVLIITTNAGNVLLMTRTFDVICEIPLFQDDFGQGKFVSIGWGSKETQFHGSEGKDARVKREICTTLADWDDHKTRIVWRADGQFFVISGVEPLKGFRRFRVFNRDGVLQFTNETVSEMEQSISWKSSGASGLITCTLYLSQQRKRQVVFFEKNGLQHGGFDIDSKQKVLEMYWNGDSTILALVIELDESKFVIQLWTTSNYHWFMKKVIQIPEGKKPLHVVWDTFKSYRLHIITSNGNYDRTDYQWIVNSSRGLNEKDLTTVAIIDNCQLNVTFFREAVIPPPMCAWQLEFPDPIDQLDFALNSCNQMFVLTLGGIIYLFEFGNEEMKSEEVGIRMVKKEGNSAIPFLKKTFLLKMNGSLELQHLRWVNSSTMVAGRMNELVILSINDDCVSLRKTLVLENRIYTITASHGQEVAVHLVTGQTLKLEIDSGEVMDWENCRFPEPCFHIEIVQGHLFGLASTGRLYYDGKEIASNVSSFLIHSHFVLFTSVQNHRLVCLPVSDLTPLPGDIRMERRIERGAKLIHSVAMGTLVILQMPRGNLEAIHPRPLTLNILKNLIDRQFYREAFDLMKKQRINLNLLYDHDPTKFLDSSEEFVKQIGQSNISNLNLFLTELQEEDITLKMYSEYYSSKSKNPQEKKVDLVCAKLRQIMTDMDSRKYLLPIVTSFVRQNQVHLALKTVQSMSGEAIKDEALKYMAVIVDSDQLYSEALGTYDLHLSLMVAQRSQMDPKEYVPFLNELNAMEDVHYCRFTIDNTLKKYESALRHLCHCNPARTQEIIQYMKAHRIYFPVIDELCAQGDVATKEALHTAVVCQTEHLEARGNFEEAGYLFQRCEMYDKALDAFLRCGLWRNCLSLAESIGWSKVAIKEVAEKLIKRLEISKRYSEAAYLCEHYVGDFARCGQYLLAGNLFSDAWALARQCKMQEFTDVMVQNALSDSIQTMEDKLNQMESECAKYVSRLSIVRQNILEKMENSQSPNLPNADLYSETGSSIVSVSSGTSGKTFRSSKNRRKLERKKLQLKEGSPYEDLALIHQLYQMYSSLSTVTSDVSSILRGAVLISKDWQKAKDLQKTCESFLKSMEERKKVIWNFETLKKTEENDQVYGPLSTTEDVISHMQKARTEYFAIRYAELEPKLRFPPDAVSDNCWKLDILK